MSDNVERSLGRIEEALRNQGGWMRSIDGKLDQHVATPHADVSEVKTNTRWRWGLAGIIAFISAVGTVMAIFG